MKTPDKIEKLKQLETLIRYMDSQFSVFGFRFGIDGLIGLVPGLGDVAGGLVSILIILRIRNIGVSEEVLNKMMRNVLIDVFVGSVPLLGDMFDFGFKVNERNMKLAKKHLNSAQNN